MLDTTNTIVALPLTAYCLVSFDSIDDGSASHFTLHHNDMGSCWF